MHPERKRLTRAGVLQQQCPPIASCYGRRTAKGPLWSTRVAAAGAAAGATSASPRGRRSPAGAAAGPLLRSPGAPQKLFREQQRPTYESSLAGSHTCAARLYRVAAAMQRIPLPMRQSPL